MNDNKEIKTAFKYLEENKLLLNENSTYFINSLKKYFTRNKTLSERQQKALFEIQNSLLINN
jgi:hypothetical protein